MIPFPRPSLFALVFLAPGILNAQSTASPRERILFNRAWHFQKDDPAGTGDTLDYDKLKPWLLPSANAFVAPEKSAERPTGEDPGKGVEYAQVSLDAKSWRKLDLPHDWGIEGPFDQRLPGETAKLPWHGVAWYRKTFDIPASDRGRSIFLEIDGAMSHSAVWCNGQLVGGWPYGYASYQLDLTNFIRPGESNTLAIRLNNPKESSRWYPGGGIYRNVWLTKVSSVHVEQWGTHVTTPQVSPAEATVAVKAVIANRSDKSAAVRVATRLFKASADGNPEGASLASSPAASLTIAPGASAPNVVSIKLSKPKVWDVTRPERYVAVTLIQQNGEIVDRHETPFGIRTFEFTKDDGFHLNGKRVDLKGVCLHHDLGALGSAFNMRAAERQLETMREMGGNAIRTSHNPPAPEFLELCDRMGFVVIAEAFDCWKSSKKRNDYGRLFDDWSEPDMRSLVRHYRNHPSVVLWSLGNEIGEQNRPEGVPMANRLNSFAHAEDGTRPSTIGCSNNRGGFNGFQNNIDVFGINYFHVNYKDFREKNPKIPFYSSESASTISSRGEYFYGKDSWRTDFQVNSYDESKPAWGTLPDDQFRKLEEFPMAAGEFVWTGTDYLGEPTPYNSDMSNLLNYTTPEAKAAAEKELKELGKIKTPSRSSYFGIVDLAGFKKDRFHLYQSRWRPDLPMAHILPHWNWPGREGEATPVHVYTSGDEAELFLNGKSLGRKKKGRFEYRLKWDDVKYAPGELKVVASKNGKEWATSTVKTTGPAAKLLLAPDRAIITADGRDLSFITATVADADGALVPRSKQALKFEISGPGEIVATDNGDPTDHTVFRSPERKAFNGLALAIVRLNPEATAPVTVRVTSEGLTAASVTIQPAAP